MRDLRPEMSGSRYEGVPIIMPRGGRACLQGCRTHTGAPTWEGSRWQHQQVVASLPSSPLNRALPEFGPPLCVPLTKPFFFLVLWSCENLVVLEDTETDGGRRGVGEALELAAG